MNHLKPSIDFLLETSSLDRISSEQINTSIVASVLLNRTIGLNQSTSTPSILAVSAHRYIAPTNFYTHAIQNMDFLTTTFSPYFRVKLTYAFIMFSCIILNSFILFYYYLKAAYFNPWHKLDSTIPSNCMFCDSPVSIDTNYITSARKSARSQQVQHGIKWNHKKRKYL
jgi:hypothetical protein